MHYDKRNLENIAKLADNTRAAALKWYDFLVKNEIGVLIYETIRDIETQRANVKKGASQTMKSYHLVGQALDFVPVVDRDRTDWNGYKRPEIVKAIAEAKRLGFEWGGDWKTFVDRPHLQFNYKGYGTDTFNGPKEYKLTIPNAAFWQAKALVKEFEGKGYKCHGSTVKVYKPGEHPEDNDPFKFIIFADESKVTALLAELRDRGYTRTTKEEV